MAAAWNLSEDVWKTESMTQRDSDVWWNEIQKDSADAKCCVCWNWAELINRLTPSIPQSTVVVQLHTWPKRTGSVCQRSKGTMQGSKHKPISRRAGVLSAKGLRAGGGQRISPPTGLKRAAKSTLERPRKKNAKVLEQPQTPDSIPRENLWNDSKIEPYLRSPNVLSWCRCSRKRAGGEPWQKPRHHDRYSFNSGSSYHVCCEMDASWWQVITPSVSSVLASLSTFFGFRADSKCFGLLPFQTNHRNTFHTKFPQNHR